MPLTELEKPEVIEKVKSHHKKQLEKLKLNKNKILIILVLAFIFYLWAELGVGLFFQNSWGGQ